MSIDKGLIILDFDKTAIMNDSINVFIVRNLLHPKVMALLIWAILHKIGIISHLAYKKKVVEVLQVKKKLINSRLKNSIMKKKSGIFDFCLGSNFDILIVSATPYYLVNSLIGDLVCSSFFIAGEKYNYFHGSDKVHAVEAFMAQSKKSYDLLIGIGDSKSDLALCCICDYFILVNNRKIESIHETRTTFD